MLRTLQVRRVAARLTGAFPDINTEEARSRARRLLSTAGPLTTIFAAEYLISGERMARHYESMWARLGRER